MLVAFSTTIPTFLTYTAGYARLPPRATNCRKRGCGHSNQLRPRKKWVDLYPLYLLKRMLRRSQTQMSTSQWDTISSSSRNPGARVHYPKCICFDRVSWWIKERIRSSTCSQILHLEVTWLYFFSSFSLVLDLILYSTVWALLVKETAIEFSILRGQNPLYIANALSREA